MKKQIIVKDGEKYLQVLRKKTKTLIKGWKGSDEGEVKFNLTKVYKMKELANFLKKFNWERVERCLSNITQFPVKFEFEKLEKDKYKENYIIRIKDFNIPLEELGLFGRLLKDAQLGIWNSYLEVDDITGDLWFWFGYHLEYTHLGGGHNGTSVVRVKINLDRNTLYFKELESRDYVEYCLS